jgi:hypothetical protein
VEQVSKPIEITTSEGLYAHPGDFVMVNGRVLRITAINGTRVFVKPLPRYRRVFAWIKRRLP